MIFRKPDGAGAVRLMASSAIVVAEDRRRPPAHPDFRRQAATQLGAAMRIGDIGAVVATLRTLDPWALNN